MKVVISAGGKGTRISSVASDIPKPMIPIDGIPVLEREINSLKKQGFDDIIITVSHMGNIIMDYFKDGSKFGVKIEYFNEINPLGTAGALFKLKDKLTEDFLLLNADAVFDVDFRRFVNFHKEKGGLATLFTHPNSHPYDSGLIITDNNGCVEEWLAKEDQRPRYYKNRVNAGLHVLSPKILDVKISDEKIDLDRQILKPLAGTGKMFAYDSPEYVKDMGTPERYYSVQQNFVSGVVEAKNLKNKQKAIFLYINVVINNINDIDCINLNNNVVQTIKSLNEQGYLTIIIDNKTDFFGNEKINMIHNKIETLLGNEGAYVDFIYNYNNNFESILDLINNFNIDLSLSWLIGLETKELLELKELKCKTAIITSENFNDNIILSNLIKILDLL